MQQLSGGGQLLGQRESRDGEENRQRNFGKNDANSFPPAIMSTFLFAKKLGPVESHGQAMRILVNLFCPTRSYVSLVAFNLAWALGTITSSKIAPSVASIQIQDGGLTRLCCSSCKIKILIKLISSCLFKAKRNAEKTSEE